MRSTTFSLTCSAPRCPASRGVPFSATALASQQRAHLDLAVEGTADDVAEDTEDQGEEESTEAPDRGGDTEEQPGKQPEGGISHGVGPICAVVVETEQGGAHPARVRRGVT